MRRTLIALAATAATGLVGLGAVGAQAAPLAPQLPVQPSTDIQQVDWYCGPRCEQRYHRRWEKRHNYWRDRPDPYYGYNYNYNYGRQYPGYYYR